MAEIGNSNVFSAQNRVVSKKKVYTEFETDFSAQIGNSSVFSAQIGNSSVFSAQNQVVSKKTNLRLIFRPKSEIQTFEGGCFPMGGGLFSIFHKKSASKPPKRCDFAFFTANGGGLEPPLPPLATLLGISMYLVHLRQLRPAIISIISCSSVDCKAMDEDCRFPRNLLNDCSSLLSIATKDGTGQDFLDPTGKFQNHRRLTGRSTGF